VLLSEASVALPASRRLRVRTPSVVEVTIEPPAGVVVEAVLGPPGPVEASPVDAPDAATAVAWSTKAGDPPRREVVLAAGLLVLRVAARDGAAVSAGVRVRALPPR
jgi:hypothetical protein